MSDETMSVLITKFLDYSFPYATFCWHGGEPTLAGPKFFSRALSLIEQRQQAGHVITHQLQTNGSGITDELASVFKGGGFKVGISLDGPEHVHNLNRQTAGRSGTFKRTMRGLGVLRSHGIPTSVIATVSKPTLAYARETFESLVGAGFRSISYSPVFDSMEPDGLSLTDEEWYLYLQQVFDLWWENGDPDIGIRELNDAIAWISGKNISCCSSSGTCAHWLSVDRDGAVYPCERYNQAVCFGNINEVSFNDIAASTAFGKFAKGCQYIHPECEECEYLPLCSNGCPNMRVSSSRFSARGKYGFCNQRRALYRYISARFASV